MHPQLVCKADSTCTHELVGFVGNRSSVRHTLSRPRRRKAPGEGGESRELSELLHVAEVLLALLGKASQDGLPVRGLV